MFVTFTSLLKLCSIFSVPIWAVTISVSGVGPLRMPYQVLRGTGATDRGTPQAGDRNGMP